MEKFEPEKESEFAKEVVENIRTAQLGRVVDVLIEELNKDETLVQLEELIEYFPEGEPKQVTTIGARTFKHFGPQGGSATIEYNLTYEYEFEAGFAVAQVVVVGNVPDAKIKGVHITRLEESLAETHAFKLGGKSAAQYGFLMFVLAIPLFILAMLVKCIRSRNLQRKWMWVLFIILGFVTFQLNWTTGEADFTPISFVLFGASASRASPYSPWIISFALPIGALWFYLKGVVGGKSEPAEG